MTEDSEDSSGARRLLEISEVASGWFQRWYFDLRLEEEVYRARRHALPLSVAVIRLGQGWSPDASECKQVLADIGGKLRRTDLPTVLSLTDLAVCLTHTGEHEARTVVERLEEDLRPFAPKYGVASLSDEHQTGVDLLRAALARL